MKTLKGILVAALMLAFIVGMGALHQRAEGSGLTGIPYFPTFGGITVTGTSTTAGITDSSSISTTGMVNAAGMQTTGSGCVAGNICAALSGQHFLANATNGGYGSGNNASVGYEFSGGANLVLNADTAGNAIFKSSGTEKAQILLGNTATDPIFVGQSGQNVASAKMYAFRITNNGTTCASLQTMPTGWSVARTSAGKCTITMPAVTTATNVIAIAAPGATDTDAYCNSSANSTTTILNSCFNGAGTLTDSNYYVMIQDWN